MNSRIRTYTVLYINTSVLVCMYVWRSPRQKHSSTHTNQDTVSMYVSNKELSCMCVFSMCVCVSHVIVI